MIVAAFDPGGTTGVVVAEVHPDENVLHLRHAIDLGVDNFLKAYFGEAPVGGLNDFWYNYVVVEDWRLYPNMGQRLMGQHMPAAEMLGVVRVIAHSNSCPMTRQLASQAKGQWPNKRLKKHPEFAEVKGHAKDALRHLLTFCENSLEMQIVNKDLAI